VDLQQKDCRNNWQPCICYLKGGVTMEIKNEAIKNSSVIPDKSEKNDKKVAKTQKWLIQIMKVGE